MALKSPFPYFGGKSSVADKIWDALGSVDAYIEPFFGSGAVLLNRPGGASGLEIVNDADGFISNVWRSIQFSPDETARWCDWPTNHADLTARKKELIKNEGRLIEGLLSDPRWHDPVLGGYWIWCASNWIGSGLTRPGARPHLTGEMGVNALGKIPHLTVEMGVNALGQRPHLTGEMGVKKGPCDPYETRIYAWFRELSERLRRVKVVCGDWTRVCGGEWQARKGICGMFFDPPYSDKAGRDNGIYHKEDLSVAHDIREWTLKRGESPDYRIVLAGYFDEHKDLLNHGWRVEKWSAQGGYSNAGKESNPNRHKEALFFSPYCLDREPKLFSVEEK